MLPQVLENSGSVKWGVEAKLFTTCPRSDWVYDAETQKF